MSSPLIMPGIAITDVMAGLRLLQVPDLDLEALGGKVFKDATLDSRKINQHSIFIGLQGTQVHGREYLPQVVAKGAPLALVDAEDYAVEQQDNTLVFFICGLKSKLPEFLRTIYPSISQIEHLVAVTGTNGKTSVANLYAQVAAQLGNHSASLGTLGIHLHRPLQSVVKVAETINTTPDIVSLYQQLANLASNHVTHVALEASSHGIEQGRLAGLPITTVIFTNLSQDHLDYHGDMQTYAQAKRGILANSSIQYLVLNANDDESALWSKQAQASVEQLFFAISSGSEISTYDAKTHLVAIDVSYLPNGIEFRLNTQDNQDSIQIPLYGKFNLANYLAVISAFKLQGVSIQDLINTASKVSGVDGRMETFNIDNRAFVVDYAHTPDALQEALIATRAHADKQLWVIFGCGGNRDTSKRPLMGKIADELADKIVLTNDNPRFEPPEDIIKAVLDGIQNKHKVHIEQDRKIAIRYALEHSNSGDLVLVAGKGHETYIEIQGNKHFYDERLYVSQLAEEFV
ncbi:UDP-N-acetylmuramoyl-L-alanyl-D-glutamate--2,6-diaminopimelate ligase [Glaciecola sp. 1036]|uniref:UDP-N-acetylmuramoyl-L-alanyl-D-glutamate--2, 6-diaminopimelate ligase n=1 Tax=Alteromonadaceae TaxID=72275 RepID=UPI003CFEF39C